MSRRRPAWLVLGALALAAALVGGRAPRAEGPAIRVDQVGYRPADPKVAFVAAAPRSFVVREAATQRPVFEGVAGPPGPLDPASGDRVAALDFGPLTSPGEYVVTAPGVASSPPFRIGPRIYAEPLRAALRIFGYQRCGTAIRDGSPFAHPACHLADAMVWGQAGERRAVTGGWHDAGDYGKYVPAAGITLWHLAATHELLSAPPKAAAARSEPGGFPDLLDEMRWELDWLLRMQRADGAVHHKVAQVRWTGDRAPHEDPDPRYLFGVSSVATATLAAAAARTARLYQPRDPAYAARLVAAAEGAWGWLERHPDLFPPGGFRNPPGVESGEYADDDDRDDRFWAAVELWRATGNARYGTAVLASLEKFPAFDYPASWKHVHNLAMLSLLEAGSALDPARRARLAAALIERSGWELQAIERPGGYRVALGVKDYYWGSNGLVLGRAVQLLAAFRESGRPAFQRAALDQLHYVFGRNALGKSFVTGIGADPPRRAYHQPSLTNRARAMLPGLLVGGPNDKDEGVRAPFPARAYQDNDRLYGVNEPAIYWNAGLAHVLAYFLAN